MSDFISVARRNGATHITLDRGAEGNIVSDAMAAELTAAIDKAGVDSRYILFRTTGKNFCLGRETAPPKGGGGPLEAVTARDRTEVIFNFYNAFRRSKAPVLTAVQGRAVGFGCAMAALCDITIASEDATFAIPEMLRNIMPTIAMSACVDRVSRKGLLYLVYSCQEIDARTALAFGLVSQVVPAAKLDATIDAFCASLDDRKEHALLAAKEYANHAIGMNVHAATDFARNLHATINSAAEMKPIPEKFEF